MKNIAKNLLVLASSTVVATGCTSIMKKNEAQADADIKKAETIYTDSQIKKPSSLVTVTNQVYLTGGSFKIEHVQQLPAVFRQHITYTAGASEDAVKIINNMGKMLGLDVRMSEDAAEKLLKSKSSAVQGLKAYDGTFSKILSEIVSKEGLYWNYQNGILKIFQVETKVYALDAPISAYSVNNNINSNAQSGTNDSQNSGSTNGTSAMNLNYSIKAASAWDAAVSTIKNMMSSEGKLDTNPVEGYVTITDNPERQQAISDYINKINEKTGKKIAIRVDVYDVQNKSGGSMGLNLNALIKTLSGNYNIVTSAAAAVSDGVNGTNSFSFNGTSAVFNALNQLGKTTQVTGTTIYTISGQPAPVQNSVQTNYMKSITNSRDNTGNVTQTVETGTINTGYSMMITPRIESNNQVLVSLNLQLSSLLGIATQCLGGGGSGTSVQGKNFSVNTGAADVKCTSSIQLPSVHTKNFLENMVLKSGQSILIAGFQDNDAAVQTNSLGDPSMWLLGGSKATMGSKSTTVVVVTPYLIS